MARIFFGIRAIRLEILMSNLLDNRCRGTVYEFLAQEIKDSSTLSIVSAYFTIYAFEALQKPLNEIEELRFLFGDSDFIKNLDPNNTDKKAIEIDKRVHL